MASRSESRHVDSGDVKTGSQSSRSSKSSDSLNGILGVRDPFTASGAEGRSRREDDEDELKWAALARLPSYDRLRTTVLGRHNSKGETVLISTTVVKPRILKLKTSALACAYGHQFTNPIVPVSWLDPKP
ncbi:unnamed protein product [Calypogeia fissa]